ncbi:uncharacterized protein LOC108050508 [Drosophila rhopaloa]|uniref:Secreted protein n=1 Tax=Drosophila rhopaloa TaxID=1041015 RepID=A0ABM5JBZ4_DRORH|nr:uncharacterized protein LOC108050508 [Drosophila rhopaloa]
MKLFHLSTLTPLAIFHSFYCPLGLSETSVANPRPRPYQPTHAHFPHDFLGANHLTYDCTTTTTTDPTSNSLG